MSTGPLNSPKPTTSIIVGGVHNTATPTPADGQALPLQIDADGNLLVNVAVGGGGGGSSNVNIANVNGNPPALTNPLPVELSDGTNAFGTAGNPLSVNVITGGGSNASIGTNGAAIPTSSTQVGGSDGTNLQPLQVDASKNLKVIVNTALPAGSNVIGHVITDSGSVTNATLSAETTKVIGTVNQGTSPWVISGAVTTSGTATVVGTLTNNNAAPSTNNIGALTAIANAANPSFTEGDQVLVSVDLSGHQRVVATGAAASGAAASGNPVLIGGVDGSGNIQQIPVVVSTAAGPNKVLVIGGSNTVNNCYPLGLTSGGQIATVRGTANADGVSNTDGLLYDNNVGVQYPLSIHESIFNGTTWDRLRSATIGNAVAATGILAASPYVQYNTTLPAPTAGQYTAAQCDTVGSTYVNIEGRKATYSAFASFTAVAGDIAVLPGSASKTIRVIRVEVSFTTSGTAAIEAVQLIKRSAADTSGTSAAMTAVPHDSNFSAASAAPLNYTVAPTPGAAVGTIRGVQFNDASSLVPGANTWIWDFGSRPSSSIVLRGVAQMLCVNLPTAVATQTATISFEWTEE